MLNVLMLCVLSLIVMMVSLYYAECIYVRYHYDGFDYAQCLYAECCYAEYHYIGYLYAEYHYTECFYAQRHSTWKGERMNGCKTLSQKLVRTGFKIWH
jgi:hypothetical protein